jgi:hypothetical protein
MAVHARMLGGRNPQSQARRSFKLACMCFLHQCELVRLELAERLLWLLHAGTS